MEKSCTECGVLLSVSEFDICRNRKDGLRAKCRGCRNEENKAWRRANREKIRKWGASYRANNLERVREQERNSRRGSKRRYAMARRRKMGPRDVAWADRFAIYRFYECCPPGMQVDHIIPLNGGTVSGLHVLANLQYLTPAQNQSKGNQWEYTN